MLLNVVSVTDLAEGLRNLRDLYFEDNPSAAEPNAARLQTVLAQVGSVYLVRDQRFATADERDAVRAGLMSLLGAGEAPSPTSPVLGRDLADTMTLVGESGGRSAIYESAKASATVPGLVVVQTEHGALYLDPDREYDVTTA